MSRSSDRARAPGDAPAADAHDVERVGRCAGVLAAFNAAGVLGPADVHVATTLGRLCGETGEPALLAAALAVRAPRLGHVCVDLAAVRGTVTIDGDPAADLAALPWPDSDWTAAVATSPLVAIEAGPDGGAGDGTDDTGGTGDDTGGTGDGTTGDSTGGADRPLRLAGTRLYLDRYWRYEQRVLTDLRRRTTAPPPPVDRDLLQAGLDRLFADRTDSQRLAAAAAVTRPFSVIAGGPGTGKTTTVAAVLALLAEQRPAGARPRVGLAAPTGKAADRVEQAVHETVADLAVDDDVRRWLHGLRASTLHRLLGRRRGSDTRFRHDHTDPLPLDVVVVDEASMVSLALMAKLLDAVGPGTRLVLVGDPEQLASVEAGAVLGDLIGPTQPQGGPSAQSMGDAIVVLRERHRFAQGSGIAALADAINGGDADTAIALLDSGAADLRFIRAAGARPTGEGSTLAPVRAAVVAAAAPVLAAARAGDAATALAALGAHRLLCAHRRGPSGVATWVPAVEQWLARDLDGFEPAGAWYLGKPVLITRNDHQLHLRNGDVGVVVAGADGAPTVAFDSADGVRTVSPVRLDAYETVHAMTVHKSQGSQFGAVVVVLPEADSPILTRELLYTAVTRAVSTVTVVGTDAAVRAAVARPIQRASGLRAALWGPR